jgi:hypothetical protein
MTFKGHFDFDKAVFQAQFSKMDCGNLSPEMMIKLGLSFDSDDLLLNIRMDGVEHQNRAIKRLILTDVTDAQFC